MPSNHQYAFFYGKMLKQICEKFKVEPSRQNTEVVKAMIKARFNIDSLTTLNNHGMALLIEQVAIFFATEFGYVLDLPGEHNSEEQDMKTFLKAIYHDGTTRTTPEDR